MDKEKNEKIEKLLSSPAVVKVLKSLEDRNCTEGEIKMFRAGLKAGIEIGNDLKKISIRIDKGNSPPLTFDI